MSKISVQIKSEIWDDYCFYCGCEILPFDENTHIDHLIPKSRGGSNDPDNLRFCCRSCNCRKNNKTLEEYREYVANLNDNKLHCWSFPKEDWDCHKNKSVVFFGEV